MGSNLRHKTLKCFFFFTVYVLSRVRPFVTLWTVVGQGPLSMGFSRHLLERVAISSSMSSF